MIHVNKETEWDPFVKKVMDKFKDLNNKIELVKLNTEFLIKELGKKKVK